MKNKDDKQKDMDALREQLAKAENVFLTGYEKLTVSQYFELRKTVRGAGGSYQVIKNRIAEKAAEGTAAADLLNGRAQRWAKIHTARRHPNIAPEIAARRLSQSLTIEQAAFEQITVVNPVEHERNHLAHVADDDFESRESVEHARPDQAQNMRAGFDREPQ